MSYFNRNPNADNVIHSLPAIARGVLKEHSERIDPELLATWVLARGLISLKEALGLLSEKFLMDELGIMVDFVANGKYTIINPPKGEALANLFKKDKVLARQVAALTEMERVALVLQAMEAEALEQEGKEYVNSGEFGRLMKPARSRQRVLQLCLAGRIPGAFKDSESGEWKIPTSSLKALEKELNPARKKSYGSRTVRQIEKKRKKTRKENEKLDKQQQQREQTL